MVRMFLGFDIPQHWQTLGIFGALCVAAYYYGNILHWARRSIGKFLDGPAEAPITSNMPPEEEP